jgi:DNA-binding IclR family transcriptional regulator
VLALIGERPGIKATDMAKELGVDAPQVHRVLRKLLAEGVVEKDGPRYTLA